MDSLARVLDEGHLGGLQGILCWDVEMQLQESISVNGVGSNDIGVKLEEVVVLEEDKVVLVFVLIACLFEILALLGHSLGGQCCRQCCRHGLQLMCLVCNARLVARLYCVVCWANLVKLECSRMQDAECRMQNAELSGREPCRALESYHLPSAR